MSRLKHCKVCAQMIILRHLLNEKNILWFDKSVDIEDEDYICRTHFKYKGIEWSAINGFGTYGGYDGANFPIIEKKDNMGLLELYDGQNDPKGWLTAEDVLKEILK